EKQVQSARRARAAHLAALRDRIGREVDPDSTLPPEERERRIEAGIRAHYAERGRKGAAAVAARKAPDTAPGVETGSARLPVTKASAPAVGERRAGREAQRHPGVDPQMWDRADVRAVLAVRDVGALYRLLGEEGVSQRQISVLTGQSQSEVSEIIRGRQVLAYDVLVRIAEGLGVPRERMGLSYGDAYPDGVMVADPCEGDEMLRRHFQHLLALAAAATFGGEVKGIGELSDWLAAPGIPAGPVRIGSADVEMIRRCGEQVGALARTCGGQGRASVRLAGWADQWLDVTCSDAVRRELLSVLSHIHTVAAWCCHDSGAVARSHWHFARAVELAEDAGDSYHAAYAMRHSGMMLVDRGRPDDALKLIQLGGLRLGALPDDPRVLALRAECHAVSALALSMLHQHSPSGSTHRQTHAELTAARDGWTPPNAHAQADMDLFTALTWLHIGNDTSAEAAATKSVNAFGDDRREGVVADMTLARLHVQTGEPNGLTLARSAITAVADTHSAVARECWLPKLAEALGTRPGSDAKELARQARQVAAVPT
ncbi:MAG: helix-turn-helix domain-containing protein, partial [Mycobacterium sp.]